ncbi:MAG: MFS transporter [Promethearchaeota archaeon]
MSSRDSRGLRPLYFLSASGDFLLSLMIVASLLVGESLGLDGWVKGVLGGAYGVSYMIAPVLFGFVSDRLGRRNCLLIATSGIILVGILFMSFSRNFWVLVSGEIAVGVLNGLFWPSIEALTSERGAGIDHQKRISYFCISWSIGYMLGPFIAPILDDYSPIYSFTIFTAIAVANLVVVMKLLSSTSEEIRVDGRQGGQGRQGRQGRQGWQGRQGRQGRQGWQGERGGQGGDGWQGERGGQGGDGRQGRQGRGDGGSHVHEKMPGLIATSAMLVLLASTYAFVKAFIIGFYPDMSKHVFGWDGLQTGILMLAFGLSRTASFAFHSLVKFRGFGWGVGFSVILSGSVFLLLFSRNYAWIMFMFIIFGFLTGLVYATSLDKLMKVNETYKGFAAGWFESSMGIGTLVGPIIAGLVLSHGNIELTYLAIGLSSILISLCAFTFFIALRRRGDRLEFPYSPESDSSPG